MALLLRTSKLAACRPLGTSLALRAASTVSASSLGIDKSTGISKPAFYRNLSYPDIYEHEVANKEGVTASNGCFTVSTGKFTGRSPNDKFFVKQAPSEKHLDWGKVNMPITAEVYAEVRKRAVDHFNKNVKKAYVFDGFCGTNPKSRKAVRIITELAWQHHFVTNMFIRSSSPKEVENFKPDFTIINACKVTHPDWKKLNLHSEVAAVFNAEERQAVITGTWYGGEMKKGVFSMMNYWLPLEGVMAMHCSANKGKGGDTVLFFGLSGTGKTTLSADPNRYLIGDDEHGWDDDGIFNFEGGCYAKTIRLRRENEPEIFDAIKRDALLENVKLNGPENEVDYDDKSITENGRVSYPIYHIANYEPSGMGGHPDNIIFLTCDAFGVLPPVARLNEGQAMYHFLSGYTAKVAGTERGIKEPVPNFSACFGAAFMTLHPTKYADLLKKKLQNHKTSCYLVNTGWTGGAYGVGERMSIKATRACVDAILDGSIKDTSFKTDDIFGFEVPTKLKGVKPEVLDPEQSWSDKAAFAKSRDELAAKFKKNYEQFRKPGMTDYAAFGPK